MSQEKYSSQSFSIEHIIPVVHSGGNEIGNLALSCQGCNNSKFTKLTALDMESNLTTDLFHPRKDIWTEHFCWNQNFTIVIGKTAKGRATVQALKLNRERLINQRIIYKICGLHPPQHSIA